MRDYGFEFQGVTHRRRGRAGPPRRRHGVPSRVYRQGAGRRGRGEWAARYGEEFDAFHRSARAERLGAWYEVRPRRRPPEPEAGRLFPPELEERLRPHRPVRGYDPHAVHIYDLDYGRQAGGPAEYSGRAGYPAPDATIAVPEPGYRREAYGGRRYGAPGYGLEYGPAPSRREERWAPYDYGVEMYRPRRPRPGRRRRRRSGPRYEDRHWSAAEPPPIDRGARRGWTRGLT